MIRLLATLVLLAALGGDEISIRARWACSERDGDAPMKITINQQGKPRVVLTQSEFWDFKPSWSPDGSQITFFRMIKYGADFKDWRTKLCVINADGTGFKELTSGEHPDFNMTWTRDGTNLIVFNRYSPQGGWRNQSYCIDPKGKAGSEQIVSDPDYPNWEWVTGGLKDGRLFIDRIDDTTAKSFLLTPKPGKRGKYEEIKRPTEQLWHKLSISPSETKVVYMLDRDRNTGTYEDVTIAYADFDVKTRKIANQKEISEYETVFIDEYPRWSRDEKLIIYDSNRSGKYQLYAYRLADGKTFKISPDDAHQYQFGDFEGVAP